MSWIKCDARVKAKCPFKVKCCGDQEGVYLDGSECDRFAQKVFAEPPTNADRIRAMTDEELAAKLQSMGCPSAESHNKCFEMSCRACWLDWLRQIVEE